MDRKTTRHTFTIEVSIWDDIANDVSDTYEMRELIIDHLQEHSVIKIHEISKGTKS